ncbi:hypothetical protein IV203_029253 [Nitzschia inconspicua]|uniref:Uncharacterized protein n=1 Tax=Nitzschia inconspicua TaxID=303405 RepID=A0A9K3Q0J2_9STRA|nr:hypothetical protein IV203_029253 [Nitzschia inconspicua]
MSYLPEPTRPAGGQALFNKAVSPVRLFWGFPFNRTSNNGTRNKHKRKRRVHFVISRFSYVEPETFDPPLNFRDLYYTKDDILHIKIEMAMTLKLLATKDPRLWQQDNLFCTRGVEELSPAIIQKRCESTTQILRGVLSEQARQQQRGISDLEQLAETSRQLSMKDVVRAHHQGLQDAIVARGVLLGEENGTTEAVSLPFDMITDATFFCTDDFDRDHKRDSFSTASTWNMAAYEDSSSDQDSDVDTGDDEDMDGTHSFRELLEESERSQNDKNPVLLGNTRPLAFSIQRLFQRKSCWCR